MKKYLILFSVLAFVGCNDSKKANEAGNRENEVRQRTIDSIAAIDAAVEASQNRSGSSNNSSPSTTNNSGGTNDNNSGTTSGTNSTVPAKRKGMSNTTKGALIGTGVGIVGGAATGAAVSDDKVKGAVIGGVVGGAVGSGVGYGIGASKDSKAKNDTIQ